MHKHINRLNTLLLFSSLLLLVACGGGSGSPASGAGVGAAGAASSGGNTTTPGFDLTVGLYESDVDSGNLAAANQLDSVPALGSAAFVVTVTDASTGQPVEGQIVSVFISTPATITPDTGQILTNSDGIAVAQISLGAVDAGSAATLTARIGDLNELLSFTTTSGFDLTPGLYDSTVDLYGSEVDADELAALNPVNSVRAFGSAAFVVTVTNALEQPVGAAIVNVSSTLGTITPSSGQILTNSDGIAVAQISLGAVDAGSAGTVTASIEDVSEPLNFAVADATANSVQFISAEPETIALQGTGGEGRQEFSALVFRVIDQAGEPISGQAVSVRLSTTTGGIRLAADTDADGDVDADDDVPLVSNADGDVRLIVNAGTLPNSVRVEASIRVSGREITAVSSNLAITTGLPDNDSFSLSASLLSPGGDGFDGITSEVAVQAADAFNNPVPDGTAINFTTEYGRIVGSCTTVNGNCTATWNSQEPRQPGLASTGTVLTLDNTRCDSGHNGVPDSDSAGNRVPLGVPCPPLAVDDTNVEAITGRATTSVLVGPNRLFPGQIFGGRSTILAYATGEESFVDANGNGIYDWIDSNGNGRYDGGEALESFVDLSEAFIDHNEDGVFGNSVAAGACTGVGTGNSIQSVVDINDLDEDGLTAESIGASVICQAWQVGGAEEEFIDFNANGVYDRGNGIYNGILCSPVLAALPEPLCTKELVHVRNELTIIAGGETPRLAIYGTNNLLLTEADAAVTLAEGASAARRIIISDRFNGRLPTGTRFEVAATGCEIARLILFGLSDAVVDDDIFFGLGGEGATTPPFVVANTNAFGNHAIDVTLSANGDGENGEVTITATVPESAGGAVGKISFPCRDS